MNEPSAHSSGSPSTSLWALAGWVGLSFCAAAIGGFFTPGPWYQQIQKPTWTPPGWLFGPVWTALYAMMGVSAWLVWRQGGFQKQATPMRWFLIQLALNALWSPLFFGLHNPGLAFAEIVLLWAAILVTLMRFWRVSPVAGGLLIPYLAWVSFASVLNAAIWRLNA
jgi:tryptophan-rich sensory protein